MQNSLIFTSIKYITLATEFSSYGSWVSNTWSVVRVAYVRATWRHNHRHAPARLSITITIRAREFFFNFTIYLFIALKMTQDCKANLLTSVWLQTFPHPLVNWWGSALSPCLHLSSSSLSNRSSLLFSFHNNFHSFTRPCIQYLKKFQSE